VRLVRLARLRHRSRGEYGHLPFDAHWRRVPADDSAVKRTIVDGDAVAGNIGAGSRTASGS
jgi:hypothetical protein